MPLSIRLHASRTLLGVSLLCTGLALAGCADDGDVTAAGSPFSQALFKDYTDLATQAASAPVPESQDTSFFSDLFGSGASNPADPVVEAFHAKADQAAKGGEPDPEFAPADPMAQSLRARLITAIARGKDGMAGEFGHIQMAEDGPLCNCGSQGCWETLASNNAALRYYREQPDAQKHATFTNVLRLAIAHDLAACRALRTMAVNLGRGMRMVATALSPAEIVVVGEITAAWHDIGHVVETEMRRHPLAQGVRLRPAYDGASARLRSAVALVFSESFRRAEGLDGGSED